MLGGRAALPLEAMKRRHAHAVEKAPGLPARLVLDVLRRYAYLEAGVQSDRQWRLAIGVAIGCAFKLMARYADMRHVRYDDEGFRVFDMYIRTSTGASGSMSLAPSMARSVFSTRSSWAREFLAAASSCPTSTCPAGWTLIAPWNTTATCSTYDTRW
jgi:hypothetical protein